MKYILTESNYIQFNETDSEGTLVKSQGYGIGEVNYKIENNKVSFYAKEDYFYKNSLWSIDIPANINGEYYGIETIGEGLGGVYDSIADGVTSINGMKGDVFLTPDDINAYNKSEVDNTVNILSNSINDLARKVNDDEIQHSNDIQGIDTKIDKVIEDHNDDIESINELISENNERYEAEIDELEGYINENKDSINEIKETIKSLDSDTSGLTENVTNITSSLTEVQGDITNINSSITEINNSIEEVNNHVEEIEGNVTNLTSSLTEVQGDVNNLSTSLTETNNHIEEIEGNVTNLTSSLTEVQGDITNINSSITEINNAVEEIDMRMDDAEGDISDLKASQATQDTQITNLSTSVEKLNTEALNHLKSSNIKEGSNISVRISGNDVIISTVGIASDSALANVESTISDLQTEDSRIKSDIASIQEQLSNSEHFRGYFATDAEIQSLSRNYNGDYAYSAESGKKWVYNSGNWTMTDVAVIDETVPKATILPLMDGTAAIGDSNTYAAANHIHPTDTSRASVSDLNNVRTSLETLIGNVYTKEEVDNAINAADISGEFSNHYTKHETDELLSGIATNINNLSTSITNDYYTKDDIDDIVDSIDVSDQLTNYYTKTESDGKYLTEVPSEYVTESELEGKGYLTEHQSLENYYTKTESDARFQPKGDYLTEIPSEYVTESELDGKGYLTEHQSLDNYYTKSEVDAAIENVDVTQQLGDYYTKAETDDLLSQKQNLFTSVDDIQFVSELPQNPDPRILYILI